MVQLRHVQDIAHQLDHKPCGGDQQLHILRKRGVEGFRRFTQFRSGLDAVQGVTNLVNNICKKLMLIVLLIIKMTREGKRARNNKNIVNGTN